MVIKTSIPPTVPVLIDDGRVRRLPQGLCTPPFTHVPEELEIVVFGKH
ncbi:hypothetical protein IVZ55_27180 [Salmonella enterica subsp. enterica serovar Worthington]|nr:hypothetical protein [Salmonella enterica subsp. enterica serovar Worthington]MBP1524019.1 hypothetical protein [Salmonella enterica subsp. enterica serovar Worthington]